VCDFRGRVYPTSGFSYLGQDHVRSLFQFASGAPVGADGEYWLAIHTANCEGSTDKEPFEDRSAWVNRNRDRIKKIAANPIDTFDDWRGADAPFQFVAACIELAQAWDNPDFVSHLPTSWDGSANGLQHLSLLSGDANAGRLVNLNNDTRPHD
jgi:DNA-directed RNA polymerase